MPGWDSPWGRGRPGWHIECSAMADQYLGEHFDIHGGGIDLQFPHHENEIAQSEGAHHGRPFANVWMHNGFLEVEGAKMSKSLSNFVTINELLKDWPGEVLRLNMLKRHYRLPMDWTVLGLEAMRDFLVEWLGQVTPQAWRAANDFSDRLVDKELIAALSDDLNTHVALQILHDLSRRSIGAPPTSETRAILAGSLNFMGLLPSNVDEFKSRLERKLSISPEEIAVAIEARNAARKAKDFKESDRIRDELLAQGIVLKDGPTGTTWDVKR
jgi:cysteinyl-tRNA synthetase